MDNYFASEIKKNAIKVAKYHYPNTIHIGDVTKVKYSVGLLETENGVFDVGKIDLLIGGSPCQDFSQAKILNNVTNTQNGLEGEKSKLFYEYLRLKNEIKHFLLENVKMKKQSEKELNDYLGVEGIHINSSLVSFQERHRIYWTNIKGVEPPKDIMINFQNYKDTNIEYCKQFKVKATPSRVRWWNDGKGRIAKFKGDNTAKYCENITNADKIKTLTRKQDRSPNSGLIEFDGFCRYLTRREIELAQTLPLNYTDLLSYNQMQDVCGDGWTVDVIKHIFSFIKEG
jgi:site-specific DNA-cytosine methylase